LGPPASSLVERVIPAALKEGQYFARTNPEAHGRNAWIQIPVLMLKQCPALLQLLHGRRQRPLPEALLFRACHEVEESKKREHYEKQAIANKWTISDLQKKIRDDELAAPG